MSSYYEWGVSSGEGNNVTFNTNYDYNHNFTLYTGSQGYNYFNTALTEFLKFYKKPVLNKNIEIL